MPVGTADLVVYKSATGSSDGGAISAVAVTSGVHGNLWPDISDALRTSGGTRTKKWFLKNEHATDALSKPVIWNSIVPQGLTEELGLGVDSSDDADNAMGSLTAWSANAVLAALSSAADTRQLTITGLDNAGVPTVEVIALAGTGEVLSTTSWSKVFGVYVSALNGSNTITIKQGSGGTTRGTIPPNKKAIWLWITAIAKASGLALPSLNASANFGIWDRQTWPAATAAARPTRQRIALEETP